MARALLVDLERASDLLNQVDESDLDFAPDGVVSADIRKLTNLQEYPVDSHRSNLKARICLLYTSPSPRDGLLSRMPSSA